METQQLQFNDIAVFIKKLTYGPVSYKVIFDKNGIFFLNRGGSGLREMLKISLAQQLGFLGSWIAHLFTLGYKKTLIAQDQLLQHPPQEIITKDKRSIFLPYAEITGLKKPYFRTIFNLKRLVVKSTHKTIDFSLTADEFEHIEKIIKEKCPWLPK